MLAYFNKVCLIWNGIPSTEIIKGCFVYKNWFINFINDTVTVTVIVNVINEHAWP